MFLSAAGENFGVFVLTNADSKGIFMIIQVEKHQNFRLRRQVYIRIPPLLEKGKQQGGDSYIGGILKWNSLDLRKKLEQFSRKKS